MSKHAARLINEIYQYGIEYKKCGVILTCLEQKSKHTYDLLTDMQQIEKMEKLMQSYEAIHHKFGKKKLALGASRIKNRNWMMNRENLSINPFLENSLLQIN